MLPFTPLEVSKTNLPADAKRWVIEDLTPMPRKEAMEKLPHLKGKVAIKRLPGGHIEPDMAFFFRCRHFDPEARRCTNYENRPSVCRKYPWFDGVPDPNKTLPLECEYLRDVGLAPVPFVKKEQRASR